MRILASAVALVLLGFVPATAAGIPPHIDQAIHRLEKSTLEGWHCLRTSEREGRTYVERHDPRRPEGSRWALIAVDQRAPSKSELGEHAKRLGRQRSFSGGHGSPRELVDPASLRLLRTDGALETWSFGLRDPKNDRSVMRQLHGTMVVDRNDPAILSVTVRNLEPFSPRFGVRMDRINVALQYERIGTALVPVVVNTTISGRILGLKLVDHDMRIRYSDYQKAGTATSRAN